MNLKRKLSKERMKIANSNVVATTPSRPPNPASHDMGDLKAISHNSADDVRQAIKRVIARNISAKNKFSDYVEKSKPNQDSTPDQNNLDSKDKQTEKLIKQILTKPLQSKFSNSIQNQIREDIIQRAQSRQVAQSLETNRKRPGRPPKAGPSRKIRKVCITDFYAGKLSNLAQFSRCDCESD